MITRTQLVTALEASGLSGRQLDESVAAVYDVIMDDEMKHMLAYSHVLGEG